MNIYELTHEEVKAISKMKTLDEVVDALEEAISAFESRHLWTNEAHNAWSARYDLIVSRALIVLTGLAVEAMKSGDLMPRTLEYAYLRKDDRQPWHGLVAALMSFGGERFNTPTFKRLVNLLHGVQEKERNGKSAA